MKIHNFITMSFLSLALSSGAAFADKVNLPDQVSWTAFGTTSSGYAQSVGIGKMLKENYDTGLRIIPGKNDVSRMLPLRENQTSICACGSAVLLAAEGTYMFAGKKWGPMRLFNLFNNLGDTGYQLAVAGDIDVKTAADLKGKRITWIKGAVAPNLNATAHMAFGGLTWDDVIKVEVPGFKQAHQAVLNNQADAAWAGTVTGAINQLAASPRGVFWTEFPHEDEEAWARARSYAPWWSKQLVTVGIDITNNTSGNATFEGSAAPYPIFVSTSEASEELAYGLTKAVMDNMDQLEGSAPSMNGYGIERQNLQWVFPYHPGAIKYYKEIGKWGEAEQAHNDEMIRRQDVLENAWTTYLDAKKSLDDASFDKGWQDARVRALQENGLDVSFRSW